MRYLPSLWLDSTNLKVLWGQMGEVHATASAITGAACHRHRTIATLKAKPACPVQPVTFAMVLVAGDELDFRVPRMGATVAWISINPFYLDA